MIISYSRGFKKMFKKQTVSVQNKFEERLNLFMENPYHPLLNTHSLNGEFANCKSINIIGDIRVVMEEIETNHFEFVAIGSHSELYS